MSFHPRALVESNEIGKDTKIWAYAHIMAGSIIGEGCNIGDHCFVESGARIGNFVTVKNGVSVWDKVIIEDHVFVGPNTVFTNDPSPRAFRKLGRENWKTTLIKKGATLGAGSVILCDIEIGSYAFIAAGAVVTKSVPPFALVRGNPGRIVGYVCPCMKQRSGPHEKFKPTCESCVEHWKDIGGTT